MKNLRPALILIAAVFAAQPVAAADWEVSATDGASVAISCHKAPVVGAKYCFWGANWNYAGTQLRLGESDGDEKRFAGTVAELDFSIDGTITSPAANKLRYTWRIESGTDHDGIIGGGLEFNLILDSPALDGKASEPVLLDDGKGWKWDVGKTGPIVVEFDRPEVNVNFEQGRKNTIRAMFVGRSFPKGTQTVSMTVTLPPGGQVSKTTAERYGPADTANWYAGAMSHDASPIDLGFLNHKPAGKLGFVRADGDQLVFEDGTPARFWGGNIAAYAIFADEEDIEVQAKRIAALGFNLMRIHHHDSTRWVGRTVIDKNRPDSQHLDAEVIKRLDYWIKCLRDEGVYVWLDLHVGRCFKEGDEIGPGFAEMSKNGADAEGKGFCYFNEPIERLMRDFNERYLKHVNAYTGVAYKDDPAVMGLLITNENDLTSHFGNLMLADKNNPYHNRIFEAALKAFADRHELEPGATGQTWVPGPAKLFLADWEYQWNRRMLAHLQEVGVKVPVATTQMWGGMALFGLPPLTGGGIIDVHSYGQTEALSTNPRYDSNYVSYIASGQAYGKPLAITEWNVPYPKTDRFTSPLYVASISALQEWDAPMIYNYSQRTFEKPSRPGTWSSFPDPALTGMMPAAAILYRQSHVTPAKNTYCLMLDRQSLYFNAGHPKNMATLRTLVEQSKVTIGLPDVDELDWDEATQVAPGVKVVTDTDQDFIAAGQDHVVSDTGQLVRNWVIGCQSIDTPQTQAVHGWIGERKTGIQLKNVTFGIETPKAAVAVSSLDSKPIVESDRVLITAIARVVASDGGRMPLLSEPVQGEITIAARAGLRLVPLSGDGERLEPVAAPYADGRYTVKLPAPRGTHWFLLE